MRAKMQVQEIKRYAANDVIKAVAVAAKSYPADGSDEDNTYARFSPGGTLELTIANPVLLGKIEPGQKFYLDFTPAAD
ncbi:MAG: hypothetical protein EOS27_27145 [Mesorhizobium sp.]|nr:MAG: hypothetical protein EOS27_27145 [Mesorhizobium sp.]TIX27318.1 MAG: hypothetical protein E5V35_06965 [Mesorhizobium sp.]